VSSDRLFKRDVTREIGLRLAGEGWTVLASSDLPGGDLLNQSLEDLSKDLSPAGTDSSAGKLPDALNNAPVELPISQQKALGSLSGEGSAEKARALSDSSSFDLFAYSPQGKVFAVDIEAGDGLLPPDTVLIVKDSADAASRQASTLWGSPVEVKPVIATSRSLGDASKEYAEQLDIDVVTGPTGTRRLYDILDQGLRSKPAALGGSVARYIQEQAAGG
jgi:hypothetical protein